MSDLNYRNSLIITIVIFFITSFSIWAGTTGKIAGRVVDKNSGDPLPGANILIESTSLGTATDFDGYFSILNVKPGQYNLKVSMVGFSTVIIEGVQVNNVNRTETV